MGYSFGGGSTDLHYSKKRERYENKAKNLTIEEGKNGFSYAELIAVKDDAFKIVLFSSSRWTMTTSRHYSELRSSFQNLTDSKGFKVLIVDFGPSESINAAKWNGLKGLTERNFLDCVPDADCLELMTLLFGKKRAQEIAKQRTKEIDEKAEYKRKEKNKARAWGNITGLKYTSPASLNKAIAAYNKKFVTDAAEKISLKKIMFDPSGSAWLEIFGAMIKQDKKHFLEGNGLSYSAKNQFIEHQEKSYHNQTISDLVENNREEESGAPELSQAASF